MTRPQQPGIALLVLLTLTFVGGVMAQPSTGQIKGRVFDEFGASLPGASVLFEPADPKAALKEFQAVADSRGRFDFEGVALGTYRVTARLAFFDLTTMTEEVKPGVLTEVTIVMRRASDTQPDEVLVTVSTKLGDFVIAVDTKRAPITAANFLKYVDARLYDGGRFHRATRPDNYKATPPNRPMMEIIQGGIDPARRAEGFPAIPLERTSVTGLKHTVGTVSMARGGPDSATSDFFVLLDDQPSLDFGGKRFDDEQGAAAFGRVVSGLDVVRKIQQQPVNGQNLTPPVPIVSVRRVR